MKLARAQQAISKAFHTATVRVVRETVPLSAPCSFDALTGGLERAEDGDRERGEFVIELPALDPLVLKAGEVVTIDIKPGRRYRVVWAPGPDSFNLGVRYELTEFVR